MSERTADPLALAAALRPGASVGRLARAALGASALALAGCMNLIPAYERPAAPVAATYPAETAPAGAGGAVPAADIDWQRFFADTRLKRLIELALVNNRDLRIAVLNIEQARAIHQIRRADQWPSVGIGGSASRAAVGDGVATVYAVGFAVAGYELDRSAASLRLWTRPNRSSS